MRASFGLPSIEGDTNAESRPPISVRFEIPYFTVSGLQVNTPKFIIIYAYLLFVSRGNIAFSLGTLLEDYREKWIPRIALGALHHAERRLPIEDGVMFAVLMVKCAECTYLLWLCTVWFPLAPVLP